jgi:hypothetical protein
MKGGKLMGQLFSWMAANPFETIAWAGILGTVIMLFGIGLVLKPIPMKQGRKRRRALRIRECGNIIGMIGVAMIGMALLVLVVILVYPNPALAKIG